MGKDVHEERKRKPSKEHRVKQRSHVADWQSANPQTLQTAIERVSRTGGAIRFGYSRDGGAYAVGILGDGEPYTLWHPGNQDVDELLQEICDGFED